MLSSVTTLITAVRDSLLSAKGLLITLIFTLGFTYGSGRLAPNAQAESAIEIKQSEREIREQMIKISAELGVSCTECHIVDNFRDNSKDSFKVAQNHLHLVQLLKENGLNGQRNQPEASCFMCHRGQLHFEYKFRAEGK